MNNLNSPMLRNPAWILGLSLMLIVSASPAAQVRVTVENLAPTDGTRITPVWIGMHDGSFDAFDAGSPASAALERLAEDGNPSFISASFTGATDGVVFGPITAPGQPPIYHPGESASATFNVSTASDLYLSYLSMVIPSNDAFIGNDDPTAYKLVDGGVVQNGVIDIFGSMVWDAGTEVNDEIPANTPLLGQMIDDSGTAEGGVIGLHAGFLPGGNILTQFPPADFTVPDYQVARISIQQVPAPTSFALLACGIGLLRKRRFGRTHSV